MPWSPGCAGQESSSGLADQPSRPGEVTVAVAMSRQIEITRIPRAAVRRLDRSRRRLVSSTRQGLEQGKYWIETLPYRGWGRSCPVCERSSRHFLPHGNPPRSEARCVHCGSLERHRFAWIYLNQQTNLFDGQQRRILHFAPEKWFEPKFRDVLGAGYTTADLMRGDVDVTIDVTDIDYPDGSFDVIICSHVLEHVPDDRKAMRELSRVLSDDGWVLVMVPIKGRSTFEDATIVEPEERAVAFGQFDHVRWYGTDIVERLEESGFAVTKALAGDFVDPEEMRRHGLGHETRSLFYCEKARD